MKRFILPIWLACIGCCFTTSTPSQEIGIFFDAEMQTCSREIHTGDIGRLWLYAFLDPTNLSLAGLEFSVTGFPTDWIRLDSLDASIIKAGGLGLGGATIGYVEPVKFIGTPILIGIMKYIARSEVSVTHLTIESHRTPTLPEFLGPIMILEDDPSGCVQTPAYKVVEAQSIDAVINGECVVAIQRNTWGQVKILFR